MLEFKLIKGPFQNNGASPWYAQIPLGGANQTLKFALDSGAHFMWVTSTFCAPTSCQHYGGDRFDYQKSSTFRLIDSTPIPVDFGPWGKMHVVTGNDNFRLPNGALSNANFYATQDYTGPQFAQIDWDGGIGIPSGSAYAQPGISFFTQDLMNRGYMDPGLPVVSFYTDQSSGQGSCIFGGYDASKFDPHTSIFMPWTPYTQFPGVEYIWTTPLYSYTVGDQTIAQNVQFCLDSGSSQFKGDNDIMDKTLSIIAGSPQPPVVSLRVGQVGGGPGLIEIGPDVYNVLIQEGPDKGKTIPQFQPLGLTNLALVGSVLMDQLYTIYEYDVFVTPNGYQLAPIGTWVFNKIGGPNIIKSRSAKAWEPRKRGPVGPKPVRRI